MKVALFIPCYVDQFYPQVGMATVRLLEHFGVEPEFPEAQTCCGQPMANSGCMPEAKPLALKFVDVFDGYELYRHTRSISQRPNSIAAGAPGKRVLRTCTPMP